MDYNLIARRRLYLAFRRTLRAYLAPRTLASIGPEHDEQLAYLARQLARTCRGRY